MSFGKMNGFADIVETRQVKDSEGFTHSEDEVLASVRVYREGRHGSQRWANLAAFSEATDLFRFRCIPGLTVTTDQFLICDGERFNIISVENVKGRGMYIEVLAKRSEPTIGKAEMKMPEDFLLKISKLGSNFDSVADTVLQAGGEVVLKKVKSNLSSVIGRGTKFKSRTTGELEGALGLFSLQAEPGRQSRCQGRLCRTSLGRRQQRQTCQHSRIRQARSACKTVSETCENGVPAGMHRCYDQGTG